jgi:dUTP pyrophosphatase
MQFPVSIDVAVSFEALPHFEGELPKKHTPQATGYDLSAWGVLTHDGVKPFEKVIVPSQGRVVFCSGLRLANVSVTSKPVLTSIVPDIQIRSRSGLAFKYGFVVLNSPGTIDADYRGPLQMIMFNSGDRGVGVEVGMRLAQLVVGAALSVKMDMGGSYLPTERNAGGFGSTGTK